MQKRVKFKLSHNRIAALHLSQRLKNAIIPLRGFCGTELFPNFKPCEEPGTMPAPKEADFTSRAATYFVFIFLIAAIIETLLASLGG